MIDDPRIIFHGLFALGKDFFGQADQPIQDDSHHSGKNNLGKHSSPIFGYRAGYSEFWYSDRILNVSILR